MRVNVRSARGFTLVEILVVVFILGLLAAMAVVRVARAKLAANEASAIGSLRTINSAQDTYASGCGGTGYAQSLEDLARPPAPTAQAFISADLTTTGVAKSGYTFRVLADTGATTVLPGGRTCNGGVSVTAYFAGAEPQSVGYTGRRSFATDKGTTIFYRDDGAAIASGFAGANPLN